MSRKVIDAGKLIEQVKKRPALYDHRVTSSAEVRRRNWEGIAKDMYGDIWDASNVNERDALVKVIQVRWKSLRDAFMRARKLEKLTNRRKYAYDDQLSFLDEFKSSSPVTIFLQETDSNDDSTDQIFLPSGETSSTCVKEELFESTSPTVVETQSPQNSTSLLRYEGTGDLLREVMEIRKQENADDKMGNKKFLLSLLPFMTKLPDDVNLEVRLQLMNILQTYLNGDSGRKCNI